MIATEPTERLFLPPAFTAHRVADAPLDAALARAAAVGAGALFLAERPGLLAWAVVLEPEVPLAAARRAFFVAMGAVGDALAAHCPPERAVRIDWPGTLVYDAGRIGGGRLAWPEGASETAVPDWLVVGVDLIADRDAVPEPGVYPETTSLKEEDFGPGVGIVESFARNLMLRMDLWETRGFEAAAEGYLSRLGGGAAEARRIGPTGDLLVRDGAGRVEALALVPALAAARWYDPARGEPRL